MNPAYNPRAYHTCLECRRTWEHCDGYACMAPAMTILACPECRGYKGEGWAYVNTFARWVKEQRENDSRK